MKSRGKKLTANGTKIKGSLDEISDQDRNVSKVKQGTNEKKKTFNTMLQMSSHLNALMEIFVLFTRSNGFLIN